MHYLKCFNWNPAADRHNASLLECMDKIRARKRMLCAATELIKKGDSTESIYNVQNVSNAFHCITFPNCIIEAKFYIPSPPPSSLTTLVFCWPSFIIFIGELYFSQHGQINITVLYQTGEIKWNEISGFENPTQRKVISWRTSTDEEEQSAVNQQILGQSSHGNCHFWYSVCHW